MARFRTIDPALRASPLLDGLSPADLVTLLFIVSEVDDEGRMLADEIALERSLFPRRLPTGMTVDSVMWAVKALEDRGILVTYTVKGQRYLAVTGWRDGDSCFYQCVNKKVPSRLPPPPADSVRIVPRRQAGSPDTPPADNSGSPPVARTDKDGPTPARRDVDADEEAKRRDEDATATKKPASVGAAVAEAATPPLRGSELYEALKRHEPTITPNLRKTLEVAIESVRSRTEKGEEAARLLLAQIEEEKSKTSKVREGVGQALRALGGKR